MLLLVIIRWTETRWKDKFPCLFTVYLFILSLATLQGNNVKLITVWFCGFSFLNLDVLDMLPKYRDACVLPLHCFAPQMVSLVWIKGFPLSDMSESWLGQGRK